jgi:hypothetical protein
MINAVGGGIARNYYANKKMFLDTFGLMVKMASMAEKENLDKEDPYSWRLFYDRLQILATAMANSQTARGLIMEADQKAYYEAHKSEFSSAKVRVIYLSYLDGPGVAGAPKPRTSAEAEKLARELMAKARSGADFGKLAAEYSDDGESKAKAGEFPAIKPSDAALPAAIKTAVFALKPGEVSEPVKQPNGFWVFRLDEFVITPFEEVRDDTFRLVQDERFRDWMEKTRKSVSVEFKDMKYLETATPGR